jgi:hypothetical protein
MPDLEISKLPVLSGASLQASDPVALADLSAGDTKKITAKELIQHGVALIDDGSIPSSKVNSTLAPGSVGTTQLADDSVTAVKLADNSTAVLGAVLPARGEYIGQLAMHTGNGKFYAWDGSTWQAPKAAGSINAISGSAGVIQITALTNGDATTVSATATPAGGGGQVLAGPALSGGAITARSLVSSDLPTATTTAKGAVAVGGTGLTLSGDKVVIDNSVAPSATSRLVTYSAQGLITGGRAIESADLPLASSSPGAVRPGTGLVVGTGGDLNHSNVVAGSTATKVTFDNTGHITGTAPLTDADIPNHSAAKLTSGTIPPTAFGDRSIPQAALSNYAIAYIQETTPGASGAAAHVGMLWFQESTGALRMWNGNSWFSVGLGRLAQDNLRWGGLFDATTGHVTGLTDLGTQAGLVVGARVPSAVDALGGLYLLCETGGSGVTVTSGVTYDPGDWVLCINQTAGWKRLDTLSSGGGGGGGSGASKLDDLLDVTIVSPQNAQALVFDSSANQWKNSAVSLGTVTSVASGAGLEGGPVTATGTLSVKADTGISVSTSGVAINRTTVDGWYAASSHVGAGAAAHAAASTSAAGFMSAADKSTLDGIASTYLTQAAATSIYAPLASPSLTGTPSAPTAVKGTSTTQLATTAFVAAATPAASDTVAGLVELATAAEVTTGTDGVRAVTPAGLKVELDKKADLASPAFSGAPTAPTAAGGTNNTQIATTAFVAAATPAASETGRGLVELATAAEVTTGTDTTRAVTPAGLKVELDKKANQATTYTKTEVDAALAGKADVATTYTKTEVDTALGSYMPKNIASLPTLP